jgi:hypothetical protein
VTINLPAGTVGPVRLAHRDREHRMAGGSVLRGAGVRHDERHDPDQPRVEQPTTESGHTQTYSSGTVVDGNTSSYWEGAAGFPAFVTVDLGASHAITSVTLNLPPATSWATRTETLSILGSTDGTNFTTIVASAVYTFNPATGSVASVTFASTNARYVKVNFTANSGGASGQLSELAVIGS